MTNSNAINLNSGANVRFTQNNSTPDNDEQKNAKDIQKNDNPPPAPSPKSDASEKKKFSMNDVKAKLRKLKSDEGAGSDALAKIEADLNQVLIQFDKRLNKIEQQKIKAAQRQIYLKEQEVIKYLKRCGLQVPKSSPLFRKIMDNLDQGNIDAPIIIEIKNKKLTLREAK